MSVWINGKTPKDSFGATINRTVGIDEVDGLFQLLAGEAGKILRNRRTLQLDIFDAGSGGLSPALDPQSAKAAIAVKQHDWFPETIFDATTSIHAAIKPNMPRSLKPSGASAFVEVESNGPISLRWNFELAWDLRKVQVKDD